MCTIRQARVRVPHVLTGYRTASGRKLLGWMLTTHSHRGVKFVQGRNTSGPFVKSMQLAWRRLLPEEHTRSVEQVKDRKA
jgi:hypothetical protein